MTLAHVSAHSAEVKVSRSNNFATGHRGAFQFIGSTVPQSRDWPIVIYVPAVEDTEDAEWARVFAAANPSKVAMVAAEIDAQISAGVAKPLRVKDL